MRLTVLAWKIHQKHRPNSRRRGGSLLEMMLVLPLLLMLSFGVVDYGYYFYLRNTFQGAAMDGARAAIPASATNTSVTSTIANVMSAAGVSSSNYTVTLTPSNVSGVAAGTNITVQVSASWGTVGTHALGSAWGGISNSKTVTATAVMVKESN
jgi:Flp pilus assembly protein TadG